ncbi:MAG: hypothetical protein ACXAEN_20185 [Candidatus Thorarchaeota archaeon]
MRYRDSVICCLSIILLGFAAASAMHPETIQTTLELSPSETVFLGMIAGFLGLLCIIMMILPERDRPW